MTQPDISMQAPVKARVVHKSVAVSRAGADAVFKLMLNLDPQGQIFEPGVDVALTVEGDAPAGGLRRYTVESVGEVPFEDSIDITLYVRQHAESSNGVSAYLLSREPGDTVTIQGPFADPFYPPAGSRSNLIMVGAGLGVVPFRWLARKIQSRGLDWMGKVLMLEGTETGVENLYLNRLSLDEAQYFDEVSRRAFEALKTRYSAVASDAGGGASANRDALWRLMGQGQVYVYLAGYRHIAEAFDKSMEQHLRLPGRWSEAKAALKQTGHWREYLYD